MTDDEKALRGVDQKLKIQVLSRDSSGKPLTYKIIKSDSDIVTSY
jgi:hypothetical protein